MAAIVGLIFAGLFGIAGIAIFAVSVYSMVYWIRKVKRFPRCEGVVTGFEKVKIASTSVRKTQNHFKAIIKIATELRQ